MSLACKAAIESGFSSSALGAPTLYPSTVTDQFNINARVSESLVQNANTIWTCTIMCKNGVWARRVHTHAQIRQVGLDGISWVTSQLDKLDLRKAAIAAATTVEAIQAIVW